MALPSPISHLIIDGKEVEVFRCETCMTGLVIRSKDFGYDSQARYMEHAGHTLKQPVILRDGEIQDILDELSIAEKWNGN